ncbi:MAG: tyrosine-type recombinase/integrase [Terriglobia bacterium]
MPGEGGNYSQYLPRPKKHTATFYHCSEPDWALRQPAKTDQSKRSAALSQGLHAPIARWRTLSGDPGPEEWVFPSETRRTPLAKDNCWRRWIAPRLKSVGLEWVNFQVMRRTHASLMRELKVDPKVVADQLGHSVDVDLNVYTKTALAPRKEALETFESALRVM